MNYSEAFRKLGYTLDSPRRDWTSEKEDGVCISLWHKEIRKGELKFNTKIDADPIEKWGDKPGAKKRIKHIKRALREFDGYVDVVIVYGTPGSGVKSADPWIPEKRMNKRWRITCFDEDTGHFTVEV